MIEFIIKRDGQGEPTFAPPFSDSVWDARLAAATDAPLTVPANA